MKVSVIVPTFEREAWLQRVYRCFRCQTQADIELLILDDSPQRSQFFAQLADDRVRYSHCPQRLTTGAKRNRLLQDASGDVIVHFDDDDFYAPHYVEVMTRLLADKALVKLSGSFVYGVERRFLGYWDTQAASPVNYVVQPNGPWQVARGLETSSKNILGYGFSYAYRRDVVQKIRFPDLAAGEDYEFASQIQRARLPIQLHNDVEGLCLHVIHRTNASRVFPQYRLPNGLLPRLFGPDVTHYLDSGVLGAGSCMEQEGR